MFWRLVRFNLFCVSVYCFWKICSFIFCLLRAARLWGHASNGHASLFSSWCKRSIPWPQTWSVWQITTVFIEHVGNYLLLLISVLQGKYYPLNLFSRRLRPREVKFHKIIRLLTGTVKIQIMSVWIMYIISNVSNGFSIRNAHQQFFFN